MIVGSVGFQSGFCVRCLTCSAWRLFDLAGDFASQRDLSWLVSAPPDRLSPE
jgi:hypothetical protein